ncbi:MAG: sulfotransferase, partial [Cyanobacteria bacterium P01_B01_bin.77]
MTAAADLEDETNKLIPMVNLGEKPIFIVGMPRSGTTLVEQVLASHPAVHGAGELEVLGQISRELTARWGLNYPRDLSKLPDAVLRDAARSYCERVAGVPEGAAYVVDKMPGNV